jgi:CheY-like chemotaxis protein
MNTFSKTNVILLAEDDADDQLLTQDALAESQLAADLRFVENGTELLDYLFLRGKFSDPASAPRPQLILLDLNMPRMDGREVLEKIKADPALRRIPVVVLTTSRADTDIARIYELGANSFISKPVRFEALVNVMKALRHYWFETVELPAVK